MVFWLLTYRAIFSHPLGLLSTFYFLLSTFYFLLSTFYFLLSTYSLGCSGCFPAPTSSAMAQAYRRNHKSYRCGHAIYRR